MRHSTLNLFSIPFPFVKSGDNLTRIVESGLAEEGLTLKRGDILAVASKVVSACEGRFVSLAGVTVPLAARRLADKWGMEARLAALVVREADQIVGGVRGFVLTIKNGILTPNAGVDLKNSPPGTATLWPLDPDRSAAELRRRLARRYNTNIGVEIVDSNITPLRLGTVGLAIGISGFVPIRDHRGLHDIFGRSIRVTQANVADDVAAASHLLMGESKEQVGAVVVRGAQVILKREETGDRAKLRREKCLVANNLPAKGHHIS